MSIAYDRWVVGRLRNKKKCRVEAGMSCIPLREDPICRACYEADSEGGPGEPNKEEGGLDGCLGIYFDRREFACRCGCGADRVEPSLVSALDALREAVGGPIFITSGTRCAAHNRAVGGAAVARYGRYAATLEFLAIRGQAMAEHVLSHILLERKAPLLRVSFPVFYEHFDLRAGDTVEIENPLYGGRKFYIEEIRRLDRFRAKVRGVEWW